MEIPALEQLLRHRDFVARVARRLVGLDDAEDIIQETWLAALRRPPRPGTSPRPWLARVAHNAARMFRRKESRRLRRERVAGAGPEGAGASEATVADAVSRAELQGLVVRAVLDLEEPYRTAVILRFLEDLPPREIARRTDTNVHTVRVRVRRALRKLRGRLDARYGGDRRAWSVALCSVFDWKRRAALGAVKGAVVTKKTAVVLGVWAAVATGLFVHEKATTTGTDGPARRTGRGATGRAARGRSDGAARSAATSQTMSAKEEMEAFQRRWEASRRGTVRGELRHARTGEPFEREVEVRLVGESLDGQRWSYRTATDARGRFLLDDVRYPLRYRVEQSGDPAHELRLRRGFVVESGHEFVVEVTPRWFCAGTVVDLAGEPVAGAQVRHLHGSETRTGANGRFRFRWDEPPEKHALGVAAPGHEPALVVSKRVDGYRWTAHAVLGPGPRVRARFLDAGGRPLADQRVDLFLWRGAAGRVALERSLAERAGLARMRSNSAHPVRGTRHFVAARFRTDADGRVDAWLAFRSPRLAWVFEEQGPVFVVDDPPPLRGQVDLGTFTAPEPVRMTVVDGEGAPLVDERIAIAQEQPPFPGISTIFFGRTAKDGSIESVRMVPGRGYHAFEGERFLARDGGRIVVRPR